MVDSKEIEQLVNTAMQLDRSGQVDAAIAAYETVLRQFPNLPDCWYNLGVLQRRLGLFDAALASYSQALAHDVRHPEEVHLNRSVIFSDYLLRPADAECELVAALRLNPRYTPALFNLANLYEDLGRRAEAGELYERMLRFDPLAFDALARLAGLHTDPGRRPALVARLRAALGRRDVSVASRANLGFALGKLLDEEGDYDAAFAAYSGANRDSRASASPRIPPYDSVADAKYTDRVIAAFAGRQAAASWHGRSLQPVFICGMFRSGSTLAERVLAGHPQMTAGGELDVLPSLVAAQLSPFPESVQCLGSPQLTLLANTYLDKLEMLFPHAVRVTDKRPDNYQFIGLIKLLMPQARIVHTVRHPLDVCVSNFFLHLDHSMNYAFELKQIAQHYRQYRRLMEHWHSLYGKDIIDFDYDEFVRNPRQATERLLEFCGLDWDERCLAMERAGGAVKTASVWQVRQPLYRSSSGRWRHYEKHLTALRAELADLIPQ